MEELEKMTVASLVTENIKTAHVFKKYGIDFCCGGGVTIKKAAEKAKLDYKVLESELKNLNTSIAGNYDYNKWSLDFLVDHIIIIHHAFVIENIPLVIAYASRVVQVHSVNYPELIQIQRLFSELSIELSGHLKKEENIVFPYIKKLVEAAKEGTAPAKPDFDKIYNPIKIMEEDHEEAGAIFKRIAKLSNNYVPPPGACHTYRAFYSKLEEFEKDLHTHVHLENNILFPKAIALEKKLNR
ncbi:iron-sulfur cluster repair di-iron protein [Antarcticibacterium flavum]|uniref:Iron-sulfur cluster repair di-iron protein n=1 Tax=Antarcticibacterium flavum TaxID=2058175 RepID=A0A5B7X3B3_9FLAO|nr:MULTISPECIES: iron-sulfur cluster repair di-iron protein [Antarcticibacterium]MCM4158277.1 iron-sulfur cluster repair di-iron protein [Antarcticibacterium sp. W02-3]QCY70044.1 iron-sulfur cluster repair di-iron protein [Antarcticibacterium flavum]